MSELKNFNYKETGLKNKIKSGKVNHVLLLLLLIFTAVVFIIMSSSGEKSAYEKDLEKSYINKTKATEIINSTDNTETNSTDNTAKLIKLVEMLEKGLITEDEFKALKASLL